LCAQSAIYYKLSNLPAYDVDFFSLSLSLSLSLSTATAMIMMRFLCEQDAIAGALCELRLQLLWSLALVGFLLSLFTNDVNKLFTRGVKQVVGVTNELQIIQRSNNGHLKFKVAQLLSFEFKILKTDIFS
jgi:hypothetical protein